MYYIMKYLFSEHLHTNEDVNGLENISVVTVSNQNQKTKCLIDQWIDKLNMKTGNKSNVSLEMAILPIVTTIKQQKLTQVCLTGTLLNDEKNFDLVQQVQKLFAKYDIKIIIIPSILLDLNALQTAIEVGNIIIYEICEKTKHKEMCNEVLKAQQCGIQIQGIILEKK